MSITCPYGEVIPQKVDPNNTQPNTTFNYLGQYEKISEVTFPLRPIQMGARVYIPTLGRFAQVDPVEGGTPNSYVYPGDPVNEEDVTGQFIGEGIARQYAKDLFYYSPTSYAAIANTQRFFQSPKAYTLDVGRAVATYVPTGKVLGSAGVAAYNSRRLGVSSKMFGNERFGINGAGSLNNYGRFKVGWSHIGTSEAGRAVFRIGFKLLGKARHINLLRGPKLW